MRPFALQTRIWKNLGYSTLCSGSDSMWPWSDPFLFLRPSLHPYSCLLRLPSWDIQIHPGCHLFRNHMFSTTTLRKLYENSTTLRLSERINYLCGKLCCMGVSEMIHIYICIYHICMYICISAGPFRGHQAAKRMFQSLFPSPSNHLNHKLTVKLSIHCSNFQSCRLQL